MVHRALRLAGRFALACCALVLAACLLGRLASDRWLWSQYLFWVPEEFALAAAIALWLLGWAAARLAPSATRPRRPRPLALCGVACLLLTAHLLASQWRIFNTLSRPAPGATPNALRILNWNVTAVEREEQITGPVSAQHADVVVLTNPHSRVRWQQVIADFGEPTGLIWDNGFIVLSHIHIIRHGSFWLGLNPAAPADGRRADPGRALYFEIDTSATLGRTTVVWVIDLPSDWRLSRWEMATQAAASIAAWSGPESLHDRVGVLTTRAGGPGFPAPDLILGDFNTPRGSASLRPLTGAMANAFDQGGAGFAATWPRYGHRVRLPLFHLDQIFVGSALRAARYDVIDPGFGYHQMQSAEIVASSPSNGP